MINHLQLIRNIGQFDDVRSPPDTALTPFSLIYGENGRGKTTIAAILRSLAKNDPNLILERHRLGAQHPPHIVISNDDRDRVFQNGAWSDALPNIAIFDDAFVSENVCSGIELQTAHRQNLHELILGAQGVALSNALKAQVLRVEVHNATLRNLADEIPANARGPYRVDPFCNLEQDPEVEEKLQDAERRLAAARSSDAVRRRPGFEELRLPDFDTQAINAILGSTLADLEANAAERVRTHISQIGKGAESWVSEGMDRIPPADGDKEETCPFCAQALDGSALITHYRAYFSEGYQGLKGRIRELGIEIRDAHSGDAQSAFERSIRTAVQTHEFWKGFADLPEIMLDTASIARMWNAARNAVLEQLRAKAASPLEPMALRDEALTAVSAFRECIAETNTLSERLQACNDRLEIVREQAAADDIDALAGDLARLAAHKARFEPAVNAHCERYLNEKAAKAQTEELRNAARTDLDEYREQTFATYETTINDYLRRFAASFRLGEVQSVNTRAGSSATYCVVINQQTVNITAGEGPSFRNTLSAGDRNTLALAFFFASLEHDPELGEKIVVVDDPMTSLDEHRTLRTREEIIRLSGRVQQMIVLSHSKPFLCSLWEQADKNAVTALRVNRAAVGSELAVWQVRDDSVSEHDKRHELVRSYLQAANPAQERQVAQALRPTLEAFMRVAYPEHFPPGTLLGPFLSICRQRVGRDSEILAAPDIDELDALRRFSNQFHHDTNPAWQVAAINDAELIDYAERVLRFASRR